MWCPLEAVPLRLAVVAAPTRHRREGEVVHLRKLTAKMQKEKHGASAAMVKLEVDLRDAVRELRHQNRARMLSRRMQRAVSLYVTF